jgi:hypothetical protein
MGQQPNVELSIEDLPRPIAHPQAPRRWAPERPGELTSPDAVPWGGAFGTPGPDTGYVLTLIVGRDLPDVAGIRRGDRDAAVAALAAARASHVGRAPTTQDVDVAVDILGIDRAQDDAEAEARRRLVVGVAHHPERARALVAAVAVDVLTADPAEVGRRAAAGEQLLRLD